MDVVPGVHAGGVAHCSEDRCLVADHLVGPGIPAVSEAVNAEPRAVLGLGGFELNPRLNLLDLQLAVVRVQLSALSVSAERIVHGFVLLSQVPHHGVAVLVGQLQLLKPARFRPPLAAWFPVSAPELLVPFIVDSHLKVL